VAGGPSGDAVWTFQGRKPVSFACRTAPLFYNEA